MRLIEYTWSFEGRVSYYITLLTEHYPDRQFVTIRNNQELKRLQLNFS